MLQASACWDAQLPQACLSCCSAAFLQVQLHHAQPALLCALHAEPTSCWAWTPAGGGMDCRLGTQVAADNLAVGQHDAAPSTLTVQSVRAACSGCHKALSAANTSLVSCAATVEWSNTACAHLWLQHNVRSARTTGRSSRRSRCGQQMSRPPCSTSAPSVQTDGRRTDDRQPAG